MSFPPPLLHGRLKVCGTRLRMSSVSRWRVENLTSYGVNPRGLADRLRRACLNGHVSHLGLWKLVWRCGENSLSVHSGGEGRGG